MPDIFIHHVGIAAPADILEKTVQFYKKVLNLEPGPRPEFNIKGIWLFSGEQPIIHLMEIATRNGEKSGHFDHIALRCTDLEQVVNALEKHNIPFQRSEVSEVKQIQLLVTDPSGTSVELNFLTD